MIIRPRRTSGFYPRPIAATVVGAFLLLELISGELSTMTITWVRPPAPGIVHEEPHGAPDLR